jgi:hypothetical protein
VGRVGSDSTAGAGTSRAASVVPHSFAAAVTTARELYGAAAPRAARRDHRAVIRDWISGSASGTSTSAESSGATTGPSAPAESSEPAAEYTAATAAAAVV